MRRRAGRRGLGFRLASSGLVLLVVLGGLEAAARMVGPQIPAWQAPDNAGVIMTGNPTRLWGMQEGVRQNGSKTATITALGLRGPLPEVPRPAGRQRILIVGDSSFFGHGVADDETIGAQLQAELSSRGVDVDVVNGAIPGYSTEQSKILLDEVGWATEPTLVISGNLWSDNNADGFQDADLLRTARMYTGNPLAKSSLFLLAAGWVDRARGGSGGHLITWTKDSTWPESKARRVPLQDYANNLDWIVRTAREHGAGAAFIAPANKGLVNDEYPHGAGWDPYFAAQKAIAAYHGLPVASAIEAMQADEAPVDEKFVDIMHPSKRGAGDIARRVADVLQEAGWPRVPLLGKAEPFDASGLVDDAPIRPGGQAARYSPQAQLFPDVIDPAGPNTPDPDHTEPGSEGEAGVPPAPKPGEVAQNPINVVTRGWDVTGTVTGGAGPFQVAVQSPDGRPLAFTRIPTAGAFTVHVREGQDAVTVVTTGADGKVATVLASKDGGAITVVMP